MDVIELLRRLPLEQVLAMHTHTHTHMHAYAHTHMHACMQYGDKGPRQSSGGASVASFDFDDCLSLTHTSHTLTLNLNPP